MGRAGDSHGSGASAGQSGGTGGDGGPGGGGGWSIGSWGSNAAARSRSQNRAALGRSSVAGSWGRSGYDPKTQGVQSSLEAAKASTATKPTTPTLGIKQERAAAQVGRKVSSMTPSIGALEDFFSKPATAHMREINKQLGPGEYTPGGLFEPDRGIGGTIRDALTPGKETSVDPSLAARAMNKGSLGQLTQGIRSGVVGTEDRGSRAVRDRVGQALSFLDVAQSAFGLPSPSQLTTPIGAMVGAVPIASAIHSLYNLTEEQTTLGALAEAGLVPDQERSQRAVATAIASAPVDNDVALGRPSTTPAPAVTQAAAPVTGVQTALSRRAALRGFKSTRRTGAFGITGPLAVRT